MRPGRGDGEPGEEPSPGSSYRILAVTSLGLMLVLINGTSVNVALPGLSRSFGAPAAVADWFLLAFMLANTASILVFGRISDMVGRRRIYLGGLAGFMVLSVLAAVVPNVWLFIGVRALQGVAAATVVANTSAIVADAFPPRRLAYGLSMNLTAASVANTIGPTVGGVLVSAFGWQAIFLVNVPFGVAAVWLGLRYVPRTRHTAPGESFDTAGAALSVAGLTAILYAVNRVSAAGVGDPVAWVFGACGFAAFAAFVVVEARVRHPLVDVELVRDYGRACAYAAAFFNAFARAGVTVLVVLQQQLVAGRPAAEAGIVAMSMALAMVIATPLSGRLAEQFTARTMTAFGGSLLVVGLVGLAVAPGGIAATIAWLALVGFGIAFFTTPNTAAIMSGVDPAHRTVANAVRSMLFNSATAIGTSVALLVVGTSGLTSYSGHDASPAVRLAFSAATLVCAAAALVALGFGVARGGPWRVAVRPPLSEEADAVDAVV